MAEEDKEHEDLTASPGYAYGQLAKALQTAEQHEDSDTRERAVKKANKWLQAFSGMLSGALNVGSRSPIQDTPIWATPEVLTGGFVTGKLLADGPLQKHEQELLSQLSIPSGATERAVINGHFISDEGVVKLQKLLSDGNYDVLVPEEGALLVIAWLISTGLNSEGRSLLDEIGPHLTSLRFYPVPREDASNLDSKVFVENVGSTIASVERVKPSDQILAQKEAIQGWIPLYDRAISLLLELVDGEAPNLASDGSVTGGVPSGNATTDWKTRASALLSDYQSFRKNNSRCKRPESKKGSFFQARHFINKLIETQSSLADKDVARIRTLLARYVAKRGTPNSDIWQQARGRQNQQAGSPTYDLFAKALASRLSSLPKDGGISDLDLVVKRITADEAKNLVIDADIEIPAYFIRKIRRAACDTVENLVELGVITSGDTLAVVLPQVTSSIQALAFKEPELKRLYASIYRAFRRRRSLLLLNLESQVRFEELPWVQKLNRFRQPESGEKEIAKKSFQQVAELSLTSFPYAIFPNKLLQEFRALARQASIDIPLVDELAADIFMGEFSEKFVNASKIASKLLSCSIYERYYNIDFQEISAINDLTKSRYGPATSARFASICSSRAPQSREGSSYVAQNGMIIEQQQILTTQNLAAVFQAVDLSETLKEKLPEMARSCLQFVCSRQQMKINQWHARLTMKKNTAYAWRQMIFYLSLMSPSDQEEFLATGAELLSKQSQEFRTRFQTYWDGLVNASNPSASQKLKPEQCFLGWV